MRQQSLGVISFSIDVLTFVALATAYYVIYLSGATPAATSKAATAFIGRDGASLLRVALQEAVSDMYLTVFIAAWLGVLWLATVLPWFAWQAAFCTACKRRPHKVAADITTDSATGIVPTAASEASSATNGSASGISTTALQNGVAAQ